MNIYISNSPSSLLKALLLLPSAKLFSEQANMASCGTRFCYPGYRIEKECHQSAVMSFIFACSISMLVAFTA